MSSPFPRDSFLYIPNIPIFAENSHSMMTQFKLNCSQKITNNACFMTLYNNIFIATLLFTPLSAISAQDSISDESEDMALWEEDIPVVLSATRLKQKQSEAPAAITIIDKQMIQGLGVRKLVDVLRLVPGMQVGFVTGNTPAVGYHGLTDDNSRRLQVLVDGRSVYQQALSRILWEDLPLSIENISRIEVIRGPNSAAYGANSYMAIINIITEHPSDNLGWNILYRNGQRGVNDASVNWAGVNKNLEYSINISHKSDTGFDLARDGISNRYDSQTGNAFVFDGYRQEDKSTYRLKAGLKDNRRQIPRNNANTIPDHNLTNKLGYLQFNFATHINENRERKIQAYFNSSSITEGWNVCIPRLFLTNELFSLYSVDANYAQSLIDALSIGNPPPTPTSPEVAALAGQVFNRAVTDGATTTCGNANQDITEQRFDIEWEETARLNQTMRLVGGVNFRHDRTRSETFFNGRKSKNIARFFTHFEWKLTPATIVNTGANVEYDSDAGTEISPRIALTHHINEHHTLRAITALATRTPDLFEESGSFSYLVHNLTPNLPTPSTNGSLDSALFYQHSASKGGLTAEKIRSYELGYFGQYWNGEMLLDVRLFLDKLYKLLDGTNKLDKFDLRNNDKVTFHGIEAQLNYHISADWRIWSSYSHVEIKNNTSNFNNRSVMKDSGSLAIFYTPQTHWQYSAATYSNSTWFGQEFLRSDISVQYSLPVSERWQLKTRLTWQHRYDDDFLFDANNTFSDKDTVYLQFLLSQ